MNQKIRSLDRRLKKLEKSHDDSSATIEIYLDWSREDGRKDLQLLTIIRNVSQKIARYFK